MNERVDSTIENGVEIGEMILPVIVGVELVVHPVLPHRPLRIVVNGVVLRDLLEVAILEEEEPHLASMRQVVLEGLVGRVVRCNAAQGLRSTDRERFENDHERFLLLEEPMAVDGFLHAHVRAVKEAWRGRGAASWEKWTSPVVLSVHDVDGAALKRARGHRDLLRRREL